MIDVINKFQVKGKPIQYADYGEGHINDTYCVRTQDEGDYHTYIIQRINEKVFKDIHQLMLNIVNVTNFLREKITRLGGDPDRETLTVVPTVDGKHYLKDPSGYYRMYLFINDATAHQMVLDETMFHNQGVAIGRFQGLLQDFDVSLIEDTIPFFHDTRRRYNAFLEAVEKDAFGRAKNCQAEIDFVKARSQHVGIIVDALERGEIPTRVTHNDTKLNNVMIDNETNEGICMIDLDTIMKGSLVYDFGDAIRFGATTAKEDEADLSKVNFRLDLFKAFTDGFFVGIGDAITTKEIELLPIGSLMMTFEVGMRFLTDYLSGDTYFKTKYEDHNLVRARNQFKLVSGMEEHFDAMDAYVRQFIKH